MKITRKFEWDAAHHLNLPYKSKCIGQHGHSYVIEVTLEGPVNEYGMVLDFYDFDQWVNNVSFDHTDLSKNFYFKDINPTAENIVTYLKRELDQTLPERILGPDVKIQKIRVYETRKSYAEETW